MTKTTVFKSIASDVATAGRALRAHRAQQQPAAGGPLQSYSLDDVLSLVEGGKAKLDPATLAKLKRLLAIAEASGQPAAAPADTVEDRVARGIAKLSAAIDEVRASVAPVAKHAAAAPDPAATLPAGIDLAPPLPNRYLRHSAKATLPASAVVKLQGDDPAAEARDREAARAWPVGEDLAATVAKERRLDMLADVLLDLERRRGRL